MAKKYLFVVLVILVFLVGCKGSQPKETPQKKPFIGGYAGLQISFSEDAPPKEVYDQGGFPFDIDVKLINDGEYFVAKDDVEVRIGGIDPLSFGKAHADLRKNANEDLIEKRKDAEGVIIKGTETQVNFPSLNYLGSLSGNMPFMIRADVCYKYGAIANAKLCIKDNLLDAANKDVCTVSEDKTVFNSGAPVYVTSFKESATGSDKVSFTFKVEKKGKGEIFRKSSRCNETRSQQDKVYLKVDTGIAGLSCSSLSEGNQTEGEITLYDGERVVRCVQELSQRGNYEKIVNIELEYDYRDSITTEILVKHASS